jgi:hypothetical protein
MGVAPFAKAPVAGLSASIFLRVMLSMSKRAKRISAAIPNAKAKIEILNFLPLQDDWKFTKAVSGFRYYN